MTFVHEHRARFGAEPILRVIEVPVSTFYGWVAQQRHPCQRRRRDAWLLGKTRAVHTPLRGHLRRAQGARPAAPRRGPHLPQAGRAAAGRPRPARCVPAQALALPHPPGPQRDPGAGPGQPGLHRARAQPAVGGRPVADPDRGGAAVAGGASATPSPAGPSAGRPATGPTPTWCLARWGTRCGAGAWTATLPSAGSSTTVTGAPSTPRSASPSGWTTPASGPPWARSAVACDNALAESFFSTLKVELVYRTSFRTREEADLALTGKQTDFA